MDVPERPKRLRGEAANEAVRATLTPYAKGERPTALIVSATLVTLLAVAALVLRLSGTNAQDSGYLIRLLTGSTGRSGDAFTIPFIGFMFVIAAGLWLKQYWAVLGLEMLLGLVIVYAFIALALAASNLLAITYCVVVIVLAGWLFWKHVRIMARLQTPPSSDQEAT